MQTKFYKKIVIALTIFLVMMVTTGVMLNFMGYNKTVDYKDSYEMQISIDQNVENFVDVLKTSASKALSENGLNAVQFSYQELDDGAVLVYKFDQDVTEKLEIIKTSVQASVDNQIKDVPLKVDVKVYSTKGLGMQNVDKVLIALGIAVVAIALYNLIMNKLSGCVATLAAGLVSFLITNNLFIITRLPIEPYTAMFAGIAQTLSAIVSSLLVTGYKAELKNSANKVSTFEVAEKVSLSFNKILIALAIVIALISVLIIVTGWINTLYLGLGVLLSSITSIVCSYVVTPVVWAYVKGSKKN